MCAERHIPRRPELHPDFPPVHTWVETGQAGSLSCKVESEFPTEIHWLKRLTPSSASSKIIQPPTPDEAEVETIHPQFIVNRTITIGNIKYQVSYASISDQSAIITHAEFETNYYFFKF